MTENLSFLIASLVGVLLGIVSIFIFTKTFFLVGGNEETIQERQESREQTVVTKETEFPTDWLTSPDAFNLEARAIFSKFWILLTHSSGFLKPGDYHSFTLSGFSIFLILGKDHSIRAFHNVCRHRAYMIARKESGSSTVLGCKYHGWSYDVKGHLVKAPMFDDIPGFKKEDNSLFEIPVSVSRSGAVFINLDAAKMGECENDAAEQREHHRVDNFLDLEKNKSRWLDGRTVEGSFNWKHAVDPTHFDIVIPDMPPLRSWFGKKARNTLALHIFPSSTIYKIADANMWYLIVLTPASPTKTRIRWDLYSMANKPNPTVERAIKFQIERMIDTQAKAFENMSGTLNDEMKAIESRSEILMQLKAHLRVERTLGNPITPSMNKTKTSQKYIQAEILCRELNCHSNKVVNEEDEEQNSLVW